MPRKGAVKKPVEETPSNIIMCTPPPWNEDNYFSDYYKKYKIPYIRGTFEGKTIPTYLEVYKKWVEGSQVVMVKLDSIKIACKYLSLK